MSPSKPVDAKIKEAMGKNKRVSLSFYGSFQTLPTNPEKSLFFHWPFLVSIRLDASIGSPTYQFKRCPGEAIRLRKKDI